MSSDDGIEYHPNLNHQIPAQQQHPLNLTNTSTASSTSTAVSLTAGTQTSNNSSNHKGSSTNTRRKSSITYSQLHNQNFGIIKDNNNDLLSTSTNGSIDHASKSMHSLASACSGNSAYGSNPSPSRFSQSGDLHLGNRLSIHSDRYEENITCCLPPPSPAPNNDRYVMGMPSPSLSAHHYQEHTKFAVHHRSMSPSSRYRSSLPDRYRDVSPKCERFIPPPHYLANSTPLASSDSYAYLSANVHTPVKRYVPTPPTPTEIYSEPSSTSSNYHGGSHLPQQQSQQSQSQAQQQQQQSMTRNAQNSTLPYRYRMKCCANDPSSNLQSQHQQTTSTADHYATPPRVRPVKCTQQPSGLAHSSSTVCGNSVGSNTNNGSTSNNGRQSTSSSSSSTRNNCSNEYIQRTPSMEYIGPSSARVATPVNSGNEATNGTCLHCSNASTMRRTTGVHQTTQTTGPISPVPSQPLSISSTSNNLSSSSSASSTSSTASAQCSDASEQLTVPSSSPSPPASSSVISLQQQQQQSQPLSPIPHSSVDDHIITKQAKPNAASQLQSTQTNTSVVPRSMHQQTPQSQPPPSSVNQQSQSLHLSNNNLMIGSTLTLQRTSGLPLRQQIQQHQQRMSRKQRVKEYLRREIAKFFGVDCCSEEIERTIWADRQKRLAVRRFGQLKPDADLIGHMGHQQRREQHGDRPDILPAQTNDETDIRRLETDHRNRLLIERKATVPTMIWNGMSYIIQLLSKNHPRPQRQWSRSFAPCHVSQNDDTPGDMFDGLSPLQDDEVFFGSPNNIGNAAMGGNGNRQQNHQMIEQSRQMYMGERVHGWRTSATEPQINNQIQGHRGTRISSQILDGVLENSRRPLAREVKLLRPNELDDRYDHRPFFTYWINAVQIIVLIISLVCYGIGPIGIGMEQKSGQVLVTSLSLQQVQHQEPRNVWIGPRGDDLVHLGANFAACMRRDTKILDVISKTRRQERETACCIRNDDSGCVQTSQADCSVVRGLWPQKSISTWKKWSPGESGPGGRISGSVCGLDPKYCDAPASVAPYEWPDDITKWPICRKTNSFSQRFRFKDHTAEHMVCEVIGHPCCIGVYGECRITTKEFCDFVNGYFHEEASLCSQVSCLNDVCGMFPFISLDVPDQFYRLFTSLCLHAGVLHLAITIAFQHIYLADLERLIGPIRTAIVYIGSGIAGNLTSAIFVPYKPEVGPLASLAGVVSSLTVLLMLIHWKQLKKPHMALIKLIFIAGSLFGMGTLPWQQNFIGLFAGISFGTLLTVALVPFVSITKYGRQKKINLIWTCLIFHLIVYIAMFIIFYLFPMAFVSLGLGGEGFGLNNGYTNGGYSVGGNPVSCAKGTCTGIDGGGARINA